MRSLVTLLIAVLGFVGATPNVHAAPDDSAREAAAVDQLFQHSITPMSPGCAVAVMKDGRVAYEHGYGMADLDHDVKITPTTIFHVGSISKQFTAAAVLMLARDGKLSLDEPVRKYVPELPDFGVPITLRHLLHHTSGLRDQWDLLGFDGWRIGNDLITDDDVLTVLSHQKELNFPPGSEFMYSNTGFTLLAQVVARVSGQSFRDFTTSQLFQPLGMNQTHFRDDHGEIVKNIAYGYQPGGSAYELSVPNYDTVGATSLLTTVEDLARWDENFYTARVGGEEVIKGLQQRGRLNDGTQISYAAGLVIEEYRGQKIVDHSGGDAGYIADLIRFPTQHFSVATLCNLATIDPSAMSRQVADIYLSKYLTPKPLPQAGIRVHFQPDPKKLAAKVGTYVNPHTDAFVRLKVRNGMLWDDQDGYGGPRYALEAVTENQFRIPDFPVEFDFGRSSRAPLTISTTGSDRSSSDFNRSSEYAPSAAELREFAGTYRSDELEIPYYVVYENDSLMLSSLKTSRLPLFPVTKDLFARPSLRARFIRDTQGHVSGLLLTSNRIRRLRFARSKRP